MSEIDDDGWVRVQWDHGKINSYRMGKKGMYDLALVDNNSLPVDESDKDNNGSEKVIDPIKPLTNLDEDGPLGQLRTSCKMLMYWATSGAASSSAGLTVSTATRIRRLFMLIANGWIHDPFSTIGMLTHCVED